MFFPLSTQLFSPHQFRSNNSFQIVRCKHLWRTLRTTDLSLCDKFSGMLGRKVLTQAFLSLSKGICLPTWFGEPFWRFPHQKSNPVFSKLRPWKFSINFSDLWIWMKSYFPILPQVIKTCDFTSKRTRTAMIRVSHSSLWFLLYIFF